MQVIVSVQIVQPIFKSHSTMHVHYNIFKHLTTPIIATQFTTLFINKNMVH